MFQYTHDVLIGEGSYWASCSEEEALEALRADYGPKAAGIVQELREKPGVMARLASARATYRWVQDVDSSSGGPGRQGFGQGRPRRWMRRDPSDTPPEGTAGTIVPGDTYTVSEGAHLLGTSPRTVQRIAVRLGLGRSRGPNCPVLLTGEEIQRIGAHRLEHRPGRPGGRRRGRSGQRWQ